MLSPMKGVSFQKRMPADQWIYFYVGRKIGSAAADEENQLWLIDKNGSEEVLVSAFRGQEIETSQ